MRSTGMLGTACRRGLVTRHADATDVAVFLLAHISTLDSEAVLGLLP